MNSTKNLFKVNKEDQLKLKLNYIKASQDPMFQNLINNMDLSDDILMEYTSLLQDTLIDEKNCLNCQSLTTCQNKIKGFCFTPSVTGRTITFSYDICPKQLLFSKNHAYQKYVTFFDIPQSLKEASLKKVYVDDKKRLPIIKYLKDFISKYLEHSPVKGLYLHGSFGSGKTYLIAAMFNELAKKNIQSAICYYPEFLRKIKSSFQDDFNSKIEYIKNVPLLLLDDIGAENVTSWSRDEILATILQYRMESNLPTFFTSNCTLKQLEEHFSKSSSGIEELKAGRLIERIKYLTNQMELTTFNRRNDE